MGEIVNNNALFGGDEFCRVPLPSMTALEKGTYRYVVAVSLIHGGPAPTFFATSVVEYIIRGIKGVDPTIDEVPNCTIRCRLEEVNLPQLGQNFQNTSC